MRQTVKYKIFDAAEATATSNPIDMKSFLFPTLIIAASGTVSATLNIKGALKDTNDDFTLAFGSAFSATNPWFYVDNYPLDNSTLGPIVGTTGIVLATAGVTAYNINADELDQIAVTLTRSNGTFTVWLAGTTNQ